MAIISRKKISQSAAVIGGLWILILIVAAGVTAAFS
jgi:ABC-type multidrug transport system permease subunit